MINVVNVALTYYVTFYVAVWLIYSASWLGTCVTTLLPDTPFTELDLA